MNDDMICHYSGLPSVASYEDTDEVSKPALLSIADIDRIMEMAWEDRTPFEAIKLQFGIGEQAVKELMRRHMKKSSYLMWRRRMTGRNTKHSKLRSEDVIRYKCSRQRTISLNKISKR